MEGPRAHGRGARWQRGRRALMIAREGLASSSGRDEVMPPGEKRGGGGKEAGRAEGGRREERRTREEGLRGRGKGKRAAWEGKGRRRWRARGRGRRESAKRGKKGEEERRICAVEEDPGVRSFSRSPSPSLSTPRRPSILSPGFKPQTLRHNSPAGAGGEATAKVSANFTAWRDLGCEARWGGGARPTQAARPGPRAPPLSRLSVQGCSRRAAATSTPRRTPPPVWGERGGAQGSATRAKTGGGGGRAPAMCRAQTLARLVLAFVGPRGQRPWRKRVQCFC